MKTRFIVVVVSLFGCLFSQPVFAAVTDVLTNGSFESGLSGWVSDIYQETGATGTGGYNVDTAPGTETLTAVAGFPATDGTKIALGSVQSTSGTSSRYNRVLYQDVAIPAGATTATFTLDIGAKAGVDGCMNVGAFIGVYSTASVPSLLNSPIVGNMLQYCVSTNDVALQSKSSTVNFNVSSVAGTTVRFAIINVANGNGHEVIGIDNVKFLVTTPDTSIPTLSEWGMILLLGLLGFIAVWTIRKNRIAV
jgi:hypothetical protein